MQKPATFISLQLELTSSLTVPIEATVQTLHEKSSFQLYDNKDEALEENLTFKNRPKRVVGCANDSQAQDLEVEVEKLL